MAWNTYDAAITRILSHEGGYVNNAADPGGPTKYGITLATYRRYLKPTATALDVQRMSLVEAKTIYRKHYAEKINYGALPAGLDYAVLDYAVNSGTGRAPKVLQALVGVTQDGAIGPATLAAVAKRDPVALIAALCDERIAFLRRLKTWSTFGNGWSRRVAEVRRDAMEMARGALTKRFNPAPAPGKGEVQPSAAGKTATGAGGLTSTAEAARQAAEAGYDWNAIIFIIIAGLFLTVLAYIAWNNRAKKRQETPLVRAPVPQAGSMANA